MTDERGRRVTLRYVMSGAQGWVPHQDTTFTRPKRDFWVRARKVDTFDVNGDGCADWVKITEVDDRPVMMLSTIACRHGRE